jgi:hypothetical protein
LGIVGVADAFGVCFEEGSSIVPEGGSRQVCPGCCLVIVSSMRLLLMLSHGCQLSSKEYSAGSVDAQHIWIRRD